MPITRQTVADRIADYLHHRLSAADLADWAERQMMEGEFEERSFDRVRDAVARLGLADVRAFGLTWEDCEKILIDLGFSASVEIAVAR